MWTQRRRPVVGQEAEEEMKMSLYSFHTLLKRLPGFVLPAGNFRLTGRLRKFGCQDQKVRWSTLG